MDQARRHSNLQPRVAEEANRKTEQRQLKARSLVTDSDNHKQASEAFGRLVEKSNVLLSALELFPLDNSWHGELLEDVLRSTIKFADALTDLRDTPTQQEEVDAENQKE